MTTPATVGQAWFGDGGNGGLHQQVVAPPFPGLGLGFAIV